MPGLGKIEIIGAEEAHRLTQLGRREIDRPSPDGRFVLRLSKPWEFAMGAEVWGRVQLFDQGQDVTSEHPFLGDWFGVFKDHFLYPWDYQGRCVSLPVLRHDKGAALVLYDVTSRFERSRFDDIWPFSVVWSPSTDTAFLSTDKGKQLFDTTGERHPFPCGPVGSLFAGWTPSARHIVLPLGEERQNVVVGFSMRRTATRSAQRHWTPSRYFLSTRSGLRKSRGVVGSMTRSSTPRVTGRAPRTWSRASPGAGVVRSMTL